MKFRDLVEAKVSKEQVIKLLVKYGNNPKDAEKMVNKEFDYAVKTYPNATNAKLAEIISSLHESKDSVNEEVQGINDNGVGYMISKTMGMVAQAHLWHLLIKSGQKHMALGEFYTVLQSEVDGLAEKFIAQGGEVPSTTFSIDSDVSHDYILARVDEFRMAITNEIENSDKPELKSMTDGLIDLQECIDSFVYKFKLD